jgi:hypothetical protein
VTIYERAENVVAWLGPRLARTRDAFSLLEDLYQNRLNKKYVANALENRTESLEDYRSFYHENTGAVFGLFKRLVPPETSLSNVGGIR